MYSSDSYLARSWLIALSEFSDALRKLVFVGRRPTPKQCDGNREQREG